MAVAAFQGFSIREYAAKMRSVDVLKSCPFVDDDKVVMSKEQAESLLPPITVTKFKLWSRELDRIKSSLQPQEEEIIITLTNKESNEEIPSNDNRFDVVPERRHEEEEVEVAERAPGVFLSKQFEAASVNVDRFLTHREERRQVKKGGGAKAKIKSPKKRSIAEIFAVAPPIRTVSEANKDEVSEDDEEDDDQQLVDYAIRKLKAKKIKKRKKEKSMVLLDEENNNFNKKINNKKKKNKENSSKLKQQNPVIFAKKLHKKVAVDNFNAVIGRARTPNVKYLSTEKRKGPQISKFIPKQKRPVSPTHSILKNHVLCRQKSTFYRREGDKQENTCGFQQSRKHVRFSGKDAILGPKKNEKSSSFEHNLFSDTLTSSSERDQSGESDKDASPVEVDRRENDVAVVTDIGTEACSTTGRKEYPKLLDHVGIPSFLRPHIVPQEKSKHLAEKSAPASKVDEIPDNNLHMFNQGYLTTGREPAYAGIPRLISAVEDSCGNTQGLTASRAFGSSGNMIDHFVRPKQGISAPSSNDTGAFFEPSIRDFISNENAQGRVQFLSQSEGDRNGKHGLYYKSTHPPMDLLGDSYPFPQLRQRPLTFTERLLDDKFYGLPLNSHGELIQYSSKGGGGFGQLGKLHTVAGSSSNLPAYNQHFVERDQLNLFPMQNYLRDNCSSHFPDRIGITYFGSAQRPDVHQLDFESRSRPPFRPLSDLDVFSISSSRCRQFDPVQNENIGRMVPKETSCPMLLNMNQPTMRLMGKDVAVGNSSKMIRGFDDGKVWMDKEIIAEHCPSHNALLNSTLKQNFHQNCYPPTTSAKLKESVSQSFGICSEQDPESNLRTKAPDFRFPHPYQKWQSSLGFEHGSHTTSKNPSSSFLHFPQSPSPAMIKGEHNFRAPFISRTESLQSQLFGSQLPVSSTSQVTYEHGILRPAETSYKQHQPHFRKSAFDFPFLNPECQENIQPSWFQNSSKASLPPWLLHATLERNRPVTAPQVFPNTASKHLHHIMPGKNTFNAPSMHYSSEISHSQVKRSPVPQNVVQPQGVQVIPEENSSCAMTDMSYRNRMDLKDRMKPKNIGVKDLYPCKRTKRSAVDSTNPPNIIDLEGQEKLSVAAGLWANGDIIDEMQSNFRALDLESSRKQVSDSECIPQKDGFESLRTETSKVDDVGRSGPIKLSAGAKHILKPTPNVDQDNCRPIHSTIPFVAVTNGYAGPEPQKRSTKIYKF